MTHTSTPSSPLDPALDDFHRRVPIRAWSLIVTVYGDCVLPRGGELWLGTLTAIMTRAGVDEGSVRTAMSRLAREGWIERVRAGRKSYYSLSDDGVRAFREAADRIYGLGEAPFEGGWDLVILADEAGRPQRRARLRDGGFGQIGPVTFVRPRQATPPAAVDGAIRLAATVEPADRRRLAAAAWPLEAIAGRYRGFLDRYGEVAARLERDGALDDLDALVLRVLVVHAFRRIVLRDPGLPADVLPETWPGAAARALFASLYKRLTPAAERWLDVHGETRTGPLPAPDGTMHRRLEAA